MFRLDLGDEDGYAVDFVTIAEDSGTGTSASSRRWTSSPREAASPPARS